MEKKKTGDLLETVKTIVYAILIAMVVRTVAFEPFSIPSGSMLPTLLVGDYLFVSKYSYGYSRFSLPFSPPLFEGRVLDTPPERGDIAVFRLPSEPSADYIKRVIGLPGDRIQVRDGVLHINGKPVQRQRIEDYVLREPGHVSHVPQYIETLPNGVSHRIIETDGDSGYMDNTPVFHVPPGHYFMMGDNRDNSQDSRYLGRVGYVPSENLVGRAEMLFLSVEESAPFWAFWEWRFGRFFNGLE